MRSTKYYSIPVDPAVRLANWERGNARRCDECGFVAVTKTDRGIHRRNVHGIGRKPGEVRNVGAFKRVRLAIRKARQEKAA